jgi:hypothetical protein
MNNNLYVCSVYSVVTLYHRDYTFNLSAILYMWVKNNFLIENKKNGAKPIHFSKATNVWAITYTHFI